MMITTLILLITSMPVLLCEALAVAAAVVALNIIYRHMRGNVSLLKRVVLSALAVLIVGAVWCAAVNSAGGEWSIAGVGASSDLIGTGTSIQRALGSVGASSVTGAAVPGIWPALIGSCIAVAGIWTLLTVPNARKAAVKRGR